MSGILGVRERLNCADRYEAADPAGVFQGIEEDGQADIGVSDEVYFFDSEMPAYGLQVLYVMVDTPRQLRGIRHRLGAAAVAKVKEYDASAGHERLEAIEHMNGIGDKYGGSAVPQFLIVELDSVGRRQVTFGQPHFSRSPLLLKNRTGSKMQKPRQVR